MDTGDLLASQSSIVERMRAAAAAARATACDGIILVVRKDINEYVETESAWKQYAINP